MKAVVLRELGDPDTLKVEEVPDPQPGPSEVVVRLRAAALNRRDVWIRRGRYAGIRLPIILGSDGAGEVAAVGADADRSLLGRPVVINPSLDWGPNPKAQGSGYRILGLPDDGTYAELVKVPAGNVYDKPAPLSFEEAAAVPLAGLTAFRALITRADLQPNETVLITGIGGGVSCFALLIAKCRGARVFVTSGSDAKLAQAGQMGANGGVNYKSSTWTKELLALMGGVGPDVVIDSVGGETFEQIIDLARPGGRIVTYGSTTGQAKAIEIRRIFWKQLNILGSTMGTPAEFKAMLGLFAQEGTRSPVDSVLPLQEAAAAHRRMENAEHLGKIVLRIG